MRAYFRFRKNVAKLCLETKFGEFGKDWMIALKGGASNLCNSSASLPKRVCQRQSLNYMPNRVDRLSWGRASVGKLNCLTELL